MRRISLALALIGAVAVTGCSGGNKPAANTDSGVQKGIQDQLYYINLFSKPEGGTVTSDVAGTPAAINCGQVTTRDPVTNLPVVTVLGAQCGSGLGQTSYPWAQTVTLTAHPNGTNVFLGWAGDCGGVSSTCTLSSGADKTVVAIFGTAGGGHPNFQDPALHGPAFSNYLVNLPGSLDCAKCHGPALQGFSIAPSCGTCHPNPGPRGSPPAASPYTGLTATITSVTGAGANTAVQFTLKDKNGLNVDVYGVGVTGGSGKNHPIEMRLGTMNFGTDSAGNVLPYKNATGGNPAVSTIFSYLTSMSVTNGTIPSAASTPPGNVLTPAGYPFASGSGSKGGVACTTAAPCTCTAAAPCILNGTTGYQAGRACTTAAPCPTASAAVPYLAAAHPGLAYNATTGVYTFTFSVDLNPAAAPFNANTQTAWLQATRRENLANQVDSAAFKAENVQYNFSAAGGAAVAAKREIVSAAACAKCHDGFQPRPGGTLDAFGNFHDSARVGAAYCNVCHYEGRGTNGFADSATFVHRIHAGKDLTQITTGTSSTGYKSPNPYTGGAPVACSAGAPCTCTALQPCSIYTFHGLTATYPQTVANCAECHTPAANGGQFQSRPTIAACGSCHDQLAATFLPVGTVSLASHGAVTSSPAPSWTQPTWTNGVRTNADCAGCHTAASIAAVHVPVLPPAADSCFHTNNVANCNTNTNAAYIAAAGAHPAFAKIPSWEIASVSAVVDAVDATVFHPRMVFRLLVDGVAQDFGTYNASTKKELVTDFIGAPSIYFVWSVPQDGITAPADFNASASIWLKNLWRGGTFTPATGAQGTLVNDGSNNYTVTLTNVVIKGTAQLLTGGVGYTYNITSQLPFTQVAGVAGFSTAYPVTTQSLTGTANKIDGQTCSALTACVVQEGGLVVPAPNVNMVATTGGFTGRRAIVSNDKCNACHASLGVEPTFHAGQRNDAPTCSWCHNPNRTSSAWAANAPEFIHGIHGGEARSVGFNWHAACAFGSTWNNTTAQCEDNVTHLGVGPQIFYPEVEYPGKLSDCTQCHVGTSYAFTGVDTTNLLWKTVATGSFAAAQMATSPYVTADGVTSYGSGFSYKAAPSTTATPAVGSTTEATAATLVSSPIAAACFSCHDSASARTHIENEGGWIYKARGAGFSAPANAEGCLVCHGAGQFKDITAMHK